MAGQGMLTLTIKEKPALYAAYMPFVTNGGLFIPTDKVYKLGDQVFLLLSLLDDSDRLPTPCTVVWITPPRAQGNRLRGIGVQFNQSDKGITHRRIEEHLGTMLNSDRKTHTF